MTRANLLVLFFLCCAISFTGCSKKKSSTTADEWVQTKPVSPESEPVRNWLQSIKARDVELFKTVFSQRMQLVMEEQGWGRSLGVYTFLWTDKLGDYDLDELDFSFAPDSIPPYGEMAKRGTVTVSKDGNAFPPIDVVYENGLWKVDER